MLTNLQSPEVCGIGLTARAPISKKNTYPSGPIQDSKWVWLFTPCSIPTVIIHFRLGFSIINQPFLGTPWCCASEIFVVPISDLGRSAKSRSGHCWWWAWARWRIPSARGIPGERNANGTPATFSSFLGGTVSHWIWHQVGMILQFVKLKMHHCS